MPNFTEIMQKLEDNKDKDQYDFVKIRVEASKPRAKTDEEMEKNPDCLKLFNISDAPNYDHSEHKLSDFKPQSDLKNMLVNTIEDPSESDVQESNSSYDNSGNNSIDPETLWDMIEESESEVEQSKTLGFK